ncbi:hypothetical protein ALC57_13022 [Trachymyrmex cornetzi]|uniref:Uncharacterized protein n=1 Tax=Trachymyrmex cornetzi TaxID=471704 RepID=A0A151J077_9HYME|nr:hypothetical protein ALC57_13022 [Trachymyrmex cornetzi]
MLVEAYGEHAREDPFRRDILFLTIPSVLRLVTSKTNLYQKKYFQHCHFRSLCGPHPKGILNVVLRLVDRKAEVHGSRARARRLRWDRGRRERERASVRGTGWQAERGGEERPERERERERESEREREREMEMTGRLTACAITRFELAKERLVVRLLIPPLPLAYSADHGSSDRGATRSRAPQKRQVRTDGGACFHRVHARLLLTTHNSD